MTGVIIDIFLIIILFGLFGFIHSILASTKIKKILISKFGNLIAFYRLTYVLISFITLFIVYDLAPKPHIIIYDLPYPFDFIILLPQIVGLVGILWTLRYFNLKEFLGIDQIFRWLNNNYDVTDMDEKLTLRIEGPYKYVRHPIYFFSIIILAFRPQMDLFYLTAFVCICIYFYIGSLYEERKMIDRFGSQYLDYQNTVPRIFPISLSKLFNSKNAMEIK
jgi:protein-S-isoprenylcysteine O-methyltransferase Ste14